MKRLLRPAALGLCAALVVGGVALGVTALLRLRLDCTSLSPEECDLERTLASTIARMQALAAAGCVLVGAGLGLLLRRENPNSR